MAIRCEIAKAMSLPVNSGALDGPINNLGLDSLMVLSIKSAIEPRFGVSLRLEGFTDNWTIDRLATEATPLPLVPSSQPLAVYREAGVNRIAFNVMPGKSVEERLDVKEYRVWSRYAEATFDRSYRSEMLKSPDHLIFLTLLAHTQKLAYICLCQEFGFSYDPNAPERFKMWPNSVNVAMPKLVTKTTDLQQHLWITDIQKINEGRFFVKVYTRVESIEVRIESPVFMI
jgi:hypothetical protein